MGTHTLAHTFFFFWDFDDLAKSLCKIQFGQRPSGTAQAHMRG